MDFNGWLTIISVGIAVIALYPKDELKVLSFRFEKWEIWVYTIILLLVVPFTLFVYNLAERWEWFKNKFITKNSLAFEAEEYGTGICFIVLIIIFLRLTIWKGKLKADSELINFFKEKLVEEPFEQFFHFFTKHTSPDLINKNQIAFFPILNNSKFLEGIAKYQTTYLNSIWSFYSNENRFETYKNLIKHLLKNPNSVLINQLRLSQTITLPKDSLLSLINQQQITIHNLLTEILIDIEHVIFEDYEWLKKLNETSLFTDEIKKHSLRLSAYIAYYRFIYDKQFAGSFESVQSPLFSNILQPMMTSINAIGLTKFDNNVLSYIKTIYISIIRILLKSHKENNTSMIYKSLEDISNFIYHIKSYHVKNYKIPLQSLITKLYTQNAFELIQTNFPDEVYDTIITNLAKHFRKTIADIPENEIDYEFERYSNNAENMEILSYYQFRFNYILSKLMSAPFLD